MPTRDAERLDEGSRVAVRDRKGRALRQLEISRRLAQGAHNATYLARDEETRRWLVVKAALQGGLDTELAIEERILLQLDSPYLVQLLGGGADARLHKVLAYERLYPNPLLLLSAPEVRAQFPDDPGGRYCPLPPRLALALIADLFRGLADLHREGFVHHDVKLGNLMVAIDRAEGQPLQAHEILRAAAEGATRGVLIDFGAARSAAFLRELNLGEVDDSEVPPQLTPLYAPPEALLEVNGRRSLLPSLDLYAAALVSYSLSCGRTPYEHLGVGAGDVRGLLRVKTEERRGAELPISFDFLTRAPGMSELGKELFGFLSCCLSGDPSQRPSAQEASDFCQDLQAWYREGLAAAPARPEPLRGTPPPNEVSAQPSAPEEGFNFGLSRSDRWRRATVRRRRGPVFQQALAETATEETEEELREGFATSAESAISAQRLRDSADDDAGLAASSPPDSSLDFAESADASHPAPSPSTRALSRTRGTSKRPGPAGDEARADKGSGSDRGRVEGKRPGSDQGRTAETSPETTAETLGRGSESERVEGSRPRPRGERGDALIPPTEGSAPSAPLASSERPQRPPASERLQRSPAPERPQRPSTSKRLKRDLPPPPSLRDRRQPAPSERLRRSVPPPPSERKQPGLAPLNRLKRTGRPERPQRPGSPGGMRSDLPSGSRSPHSASSRREPRPQPPQAGAPQPKPPSGRAPGEAPEPQKPREEG